MLCKLRELCSARTAVGLGVLFAAVSVSSATGDVTFPADEWQSRPPAELGLDPAKLDAVATALGGRGCLVKNGYVVKTWGSQSEKSDWYSSAKPVFSTLLLFAVREGLVDSVDAPLSRFGWELSPKDESIAFRHLANMTSGYARPEAPGRAWAYNDFAIQLYQKTLFDRVFRQSPDEAANDPKRLGFLQFQDGLTFREPKRRLLASVRDFARIGWFWLNRGKWNDTQLLPQRDFDDLMKPQTPHDLPHTAPAGNDDYLRIGSFGGGSDHFTRFGAGIYGFNWWFNGTGRLHPDAVTWPDAPADTVMTIGAGGNCCAIFPSLNVVAAAAKADWGSLQAGDRQSAMNQRLRLLVDATTPADKLSRAGPKTRLWPLLNQEKKGQRDPSEGFRTTSSRPAAGRPAAASGEPASRSAAIVSAEPVSRTDTERHGGAVQVSGPMKKWHVTTLTFRGLESGERATPNPFTDFRLDVTFQRGETIYRVPGYYAADGRAGESGAEAGNCWRAHFVPDQAGQWQWTASFRTGENAAAAESDSGTPTAFDGVRGTFEVAPLEPTDAETRRKGMLRYVNRRYLQFAETGEAFLKGGADSPENFLAYFEFDQTRPTHHYRPHSGDFQPGDPTWQGGKGRNIIGALNYLAGKGVNSIYFLTMNVKGDGKDVWPWIADADRLRYDTSKLDQWEIVFSHMDRLGIMLHVITQETENDQLLDRGELGIERRIYYRELVARFAHHLAVTWNLGEENTNTESQREAFARYLRGLDPYDHPIVIHTYPGRYDEVYQPLVDAGVLDGASLQTNDTREQTIRWIDRSQSSGRPWVVCLDEIGPPSTGVKPDSVDPEHDRVRKEHLWGHFMAGGAGVEWYFGYKFPHNDLNLEDFRSRDRLWDITRYARRFLLEHLPLERTRHADQLVRNTPAFCLADPPAVYAVYLPDGGTAELDLQNSEGTFDILWFNPRTGGPLETGTVESAGGPGWQSLGQPPREPNQDWAALVRLREQ